MAIQKQTRAVRSETGRAVAASDCDLSVIIPIHNEAGNIAPLFRELQSVLGRTGLDYEIVFIDDGSDDRSLACLRSACAGDPRAAVIELRRRFGQTAALAAGIDYSQGRVLITMDGDLQNDPHDIPALLAKLDEPPGYDVVSGWRRQRHDPWFSRRLPSRTANRFIRYVTGVPLHDFGCTLKAYRREVLDGQALYSELHRFLPALAASQGARITEMVVNHRPRVCGSTKYGWARTGKVLLDLVMVRFLGAYMTKPLYFFGKLGLVGTVLSGIALSVAIAQRFGLLGQPQGLHLNRNVLVTVAALLLFFTIQCLLFGIVCELLVRVYHATRGQPTYRVRAVHRMSDEERRSG